MSETKRQTGRRDGLTDEQVKKLMSIGWCRCDTVCMFTGRELRTKGLRCRRSRHGEVVPHSEAQQGRRGHRSSPSCRGCVMGTAEPPMSRWDVITLAALLYCAPAGFALGLVLGALS